MSRNKKEVVGTKYFLILFVRFGKNKKLLTDILCQFDQILTSKYLKYQEGEDCVIIHFETDETLKNVREYSRMVLDDTVGNYILFPNNKNVYLSLPEEFKEHLLDLETNTFNMDNPIDIIWENDDEDDEDEDDILSEIYKKNNKKAPLEQLLSSLNTQTEQQLSLDELLEKVQNKGFKSLTKKEKEQLYDYSKRI